MVEFASLDVFILSFFHGVFLELMQRVRSKNDRLEAVLWQNVPGTHDLAHGCADQVLGHCIAARHRKMLRARMISHMAALTRF